jgi:hypothetical protein
MILLIALALAIAALAYLAVSDDRESRRLADTLRNLKID